MEGLQRPRKPGVGWDKAQGVRAPDPGDTQTKCCLWEKPEVLTAVRMPGCLE